MTHKPVPRRFRQPGMVPRLHGHSWLRRICEHQLQVAAFGLGCWRTTDEGRTAVARLQAALDRSQP